MKYRLAAVDCDGTLLNDENKVSAHTIETVKEFQNKGGKFLIATGRMFKAARPIANSLGLTGEIIAYQGAAIYSLEDGKRVYLRDLKISRALQLIEFVRSKPYPSVIHAYIAQGDDDDCYIEEDNPYSQLYAKICGIAPIAVHGDLCQFISGHEENPLIKLIIMCDAENLLILKKELIEKFSDVFMVNNSHQFLMEVVDKDSGKGNAVKWYAQKNGIAQSGIVAIGDSSNDIPLMDYCGLKVAMQNAMTELKEICDIITASNNEDGVAKVLEEYCL